ncbi:MAG TPA: Ig-like domain-containing protein [Longimicrobium sp.]|jgi:hypothetical protein|uniref:Ig-like domain-containing protein n=1 Tax=Longimicrobium sp. TaxID=2029185 RepID=UPI002ED9EBFF
MRFQFVCAPLLAAALLAGCSDPVAPPATLVLPQTVTMGNSASRTLSPVGYDDEGDVMKPRGVTWTSSNTNVATVNANGVISSNSLGSTTITARAGDAAATTRVWVVPAIIQSCETNTATLCANWTLADSVYNAVWQQGSKAVISVERFDADSVRFSRVDPSGTSQGMKAVYRGLAANRAVQSGLVTWTHVEGYSFSGMWNATW